MEPVATHAVLSMCSTDGLVDLEGQLHERLQCGVATPDSVAHALRCGHASTQCIEHAGGATETCGFKSLLAGD